MRLFLRSRACVLAVLLLVLTCSSMRAEEAQSNDQRGAADLLPDSVALYAEVSQPTALLGQLIEHPVYQRLAQSDAYQQGLQQPQFVQFRGVVALVELQIGRTWRNALEGLLGRGVAIAADTKTSGGVAVLVHSAEPGLLEKTRDVVLNFQREDAQKKGNPDPIKLEEYRGIQAYQIDKGLFATFNGWLLVCNNSDLAKNILDRYLDNGAAALSSNPRFKQAQERRSAEAALWGFADLEALRAAGVATELVGGRAKDPGGELILGGLLANLAKTPFATAELKLNQQQASLLLATPHDPTWIDEGREYFFGPQGQGRAPQLLKVPNSLLSLSAYRDISGMWLRAGDLFNKEVNDQLAAADSTLTTLFSGRDFGEEILGAIHPEVQLVVVRQTFGEGRPKPAIKLPAFALVARLKEPERMRTELRRTFQSLIGFLNIAGAMNGQPQLDLHDEQVNDDLLVTATYAPEVDKPDQSEAKINHNFSPCLAFADSYVVLSSTVELARQIVEQASSASESDVGVNTLGSLDVAGLRQVLDDNRSHLISQNMLQKGQSREEAEKEMATLFAVLEQFGSLDLRFQARERLELELNVSFSSQP